MPGGHGAEAASEARDHASQPAGRCAGRMRFEQQSTKGRRERQGDEAGKDDGKGNGDRELTVEHAGDTTEEGDREEDADEYADDRDNRASDLAHGFLGGLERTEPLLAHEPFRVLKHDDGVVDHDTDRDDHREEGQDVDAVAHDPKPGARADERDGHRDHGDERGPPRTEEEEDDECDEEGGFNERVAHLADGGTHKASGVERDAVLDVRRELLGQLIHPRADAVGGLEGVRARLQEDADTGDRLAIQHAELLVTLGTEFHAGDVLEAEDTVGGAGAQHDVAKLLGGRQAPAGHDGHHEGGVHRRLLAEAADGVLSVRGTDRTDDLSGSDTERRHAIRPQPDAHRVIAGTEDARIADAGEAFDFLDDHRGGEVAEKDGVTRGLGRDDRHRHEDVVRALLGDHTETTDLLRQARLSKLDAVSHEDGRHVRVDAVLKSNGDAERAAGGRVGRIIKEAFDAVDLLLEGGGDIIDKRLRRGARVARHDRHGGRRDLRILRQR